MIPLPFAALRRTRGDDADDFITAAFTVSFRIGHNKQPVFHHANTVEPFLAVVFAIIRLIETHGIREDITCLFEADLVLVPIGSCLYRVPFEPDGHTTVYP